MGWLPPLTIGDKRFRLPLADGSAFVLAELLAVGAVDGLCQRVKSALALDPALTCWALVHAEFSGCGPAVSCDVVIPRQQPLRSLDALAEWLTVSAPPLLHWHMTLSINPLPSRERAVGRQAEASQLVAAQPPGEGAAGFQIGSESEISPAPSDAMESTSQPAADWAEVAAAQVQVAELAARLADIRQADAAAAYLAGLLYNVGPWLLPADDSTSHIAPGRPASPGDLAAWLSAHPLFDDRQAPALFARTAAEILAGASARPHGLTVPRKALQALAAQARGHWLETAPGAAAWLPALAEKTARAEALASSFQDRLEQEKLASLAEFAAGAGHEMNNPLAVISGRAQLMLRDERDPERRRELALINAQALRVHEMIADLMLFARPPQPRPERIDVVASLDQVAADLRPKAAERRIEIVRLGAGRSIPVRVDPVQWMVALRALCDNGLFAIGQDGRLHMSAERVSSETGAGVVVTVRDSGPGLLPEERRHAFDPYYSGRPAGRGLGLGLSKCWRIVTLHGGRIEVDSPPEGGASFAIWLPAESE